LGMVGGAVAAGFLLGMITGGGEEERPRTYRATESFRDHETDHPYSRAAQQRGFGADLLDQFGDEIETFKTAALSTLGMMARDWLKENLPQLGDEFERARRQREKEHQTGDTASSMTDRDAATTGHA